MAKRRPARIEATAPEHQCLERTGDNEAFVSVDNLHARGGNNASRGTSARRQISAVGSSRPSPLILITEKGREISVRMPSGAPRLAKRLAWLPEVARIAISHRSILALYPKYKLQRRSRARTIFRAIKLPSRACLLFFDPFSPSIYSFSLISPCISFLRFSLSFVPRFLKKFPEIKRATVIWKSSATSY